MRHPSAAQIAGISEFGLMAARYGQPAAKADWKQMKSLTFSD